MWQITLKLNILKSNICYFTVPTNENSFVLQRIFVSGYKVFSGRTPIFRLPCGITCFQGKSHDCWLARSPWWFSLRYHFFFFFFLWAFLWYISQTGSQIYSQWVKDLKENTSKWSHIFFVKSLWNIIMSVFCYLFNWRTSLIPHP